MVTAAFIDLKSTNDDLGMAILLYGLLTNYGWLGNEPNLRGMVSPEQSSALDVNPCLERQQLESLIEQKPACALFRRLPNGAKHILRL
jgi:hypothetical protein